MRRMIRTVAAAGLACGLLAGGLGASGAAASAVAALSSDRVSSSDGTNIDDDGAAVVIENDHAANHASPLWLWVESAGAELSARIEAQRELQRYLADAPITWETFVANVDGQAAVDQCAGGVTYSPEISKILGMEYYPIHRSCGGTPILSLQERQLVRIDGLGTYWVVDSRDVNQGDTTDVLIGMGGEIVVQTCYPYSTRMRVVGLEPIPLTLLDTASVLFPIPSLYNDLALPFVADADNGLLVTASGEAESVDVCSGGAARFTDFETIVGVPYYGVHSHCGGDYPANLAVGDSLMIDGTTHTVTDVAEYPLYGNARDIAVPAGATALLHETDLATETTHVYALTN